MGYEASKLVSSFQAPLDYVLLFSSVAGPNFSLSFSTSSVLVLCPSSWSRCEILVMQVLKVLMKATIPWTTNQMMEEKALLVHFRRDYDSSPTGPAMGMEGKIEAFLLNMS